MFSIFDMYLLGGCLAALIAWCLCVYFDKDNRPATKVYSDKIVATKTRRVK